MAPPAPALAVGGGGGNDWHVAADTRVWKVGKGAAERSTTVLLSCISEHFTLGVTWPAASNGVLL